MKNFFCRASLICLGGAMLATMPGIAQVTPGTDIQGKDVARPITTAVPFLNISPDARSGALGDAGAAISPDANSTYWNAAKLAFAEKPLGFAISYTPWLRKLVNDMSISYLTGYYKPTKEQAIAFSLTYFNMGELQFTDNSGGVIMDFRPKEYAPNLSIGVSAKFIYSNLTGSLQQQNSGGARAGISGAVDFGVYYTKEMTSGGKNSNFSFGANISDIGAKITYTDAQNRQFLPTNLRVGIAYAIEVDPFNKFTFIVDANKLLVPTPPVYVYNDSTQSYQIASGKDPNTIPLLKGMFGSFSDAPGGFKEELREVTLSGAIEYWYNDLFAARAGVFHENKYKGNRNYLTMGFGLRYQQFGLDFAYLVPFVQNNPLSETLRFALLFTFEGKRQESVVE
jgi:hypothetical protein